MLSIQSIHTKHCESTQNVSIKLRFFSKLSLNVVIKKYDVITLVPTFKLKISIKGACTMLRINGKNERVSPSRHLRDLFWRAIVCLWTRLDDSFGLTAWNSKWSEDSSRSTLGLDPSAFIRSSQVYLGRPKGAKDPEEKSESDYKIPKARVSNFCLFFPLKRLLIEQFSVIFFSKTWLSVIFLLTWLYKFY